MVERIAGLIFLFLSGLFALSMVQSSGAPRILAIVMVVECGMFALLAFDSGRFRSRLPLLRSSQPQRAALGWAILAGFVVVSFGIVAVALSPENWVDRLVTRARTAPAVEQPTVSP